MKLNPDCIRDILLYLEEKLTINCDNNEFDSITLYQLTQCMLQKHKEKYTEDDIWYSVYNLKEVRFIEGNINQNMYICEIKNITWNGHQFLNTIRPNTIWEATKSKAKQIGGMSVHGLSLISSAIIQGLASNPDFIQSIVDKIK